MKNTTGLYYRVLLFCIIILCTTHPVFASDNFQIEVSFPQQLSEKPLDGRLLLLLSVNDKKEPRFQISGGPDTQLAFGIDVENWAPGQKMRFDASVFGYPIKSLSEVPAGDYHVQALLHIYETFKRSDGHTVKLPMDRGEGQHWNLAPGNLLSSPAKMRIDPSKQATISVELDKKIPPIVPPKDTKYIKHVKMKSELLSKFWGRPMYLGAVLLLPEGFDEHPEAKYPLVINHGHFPATFGGFRETPPDPNLKPDFSARFQVKGYNIIQQEYAHKFYKEWTGPDFPRMIIMKIQHANPYYDDSYAVNSENLGPYGDAITYELVPFIEKKFRGLGKGWARFLYGGSTGGWEALAAQVLYPKEYNGTFAACPDPIDFRAFTLVNIYKDKNAYFIESRFKKTARPGHRNYLGEVDQTMEDANHRELVLGTKSRSGDQWDIWEAVYSPVGNDGYPQRIWDKMTGEINPKVAEFWKQNYDIGHILRRDWSKIGKDLAGKIHIYCGDMDNYYLNNAVYLVEDFLKETKNPHYGGEVTYGDRAEHCWNGDPDLPNHLSRLRYHQMYVDKILKRIKAAAPAGADLTSWRY